MAATLRAGRWVSGTRRLDVRRSRDARDQHRRERHRILPGGASAALTRSTWLTDTIAEQLPGPAALALPPWAAGLLLVGYAAAAAAVAVALPLRRDLR